MANGSESLQSLTKKIAGGPVKLVRRKSSREDAKSPVSTGATNPVVHQLMLQENVETSSNSMPTRNDAANTGSVGFKMSDYSGQNRTQKSAAVDELFKEFLVQKMAVIEKEHEIKLKEEINNSVPFITDGSEVGMKSECVVEPNSVRDSEGASNSGCESKHSSEKRKQKKKKKDHKTDKDRGEKKHKHKHKSKHKHKHKHGSASRSHSGSRSRSQSPSEKSKHQKGNKNEIDKFSQGKEHELSKITDWKDMVVMENIDASTQDNSISNNKGGGERKSGKHFNVTEKVMIIRDEGISGGKNNTSDTEPTKYDTGCDSFKNFSTDGKDQSNNSSSKEHLEMFGDEVHRKFGENRARVRQRNDGNTVESNVDDKSLSRKEKVYTDAKSVERKGFDEKLAKGEVADKKDKSFTARAGTKFEMAASDVKMPKQNYKPEESLGDQTSQKKIERHILDVRLPTEDSGRKEKGFTERSSSKFADKKVSDSKWDKREQTVTNRISGTSEEQVTRTIKLTKENLHVSEKRERSLKSERKDDELRKEDIPNTKEQTLSDKIGKGKHSKERLLEEDASSLRNQVPAKAVHKSEKVSGHDGEDINGKGEKSSGEKTGRKEERRIRSYRSSRDTSKKKKVPTATLR